MNQTAPAIEDLSTVDQDTLKTCRPNVVTVLGDYWNDDGVPCVQVELIYLSKTVKTSLMWCGAKIVGAALYANDSATAMNDLTKHLQEQAE